MFNGVIRRIRSLSYKLRILSEKPIHCKVGLIYAFTEFSCNDFAVLQCLIFFMNIQYHVIDELMTVFLKPT